MKEKKSFFQTPIWRIISGTNNVNCKYLFLILIPNLIAAALEGGTFALFLFAFSALKGKHYEDFEVLTRFPFLNFLSGTSSVRLFYFFILIAIGFQTFRGLVGFISTHGTSLLSLKVQKEAQKQVYHQIFKFSFPFVSQYKTGDLNEFVKCPAAFISQFFGFLNVFLMSIFMIFGLLGVLFWISPSLTFLTLMFFALFALSQKFIIKKIGKFSEQLTSDLYEFSHQSIQMLQGLRPIHIFYRHAYMRNKVTDLLSRIAYSSKKAYFWNNLIPSMNETMNVLLVGGIFIIGTYLLVHQNEDAISILLTYIALTYRLATRSQACIVSFGNMGLLFGSIKRLNEILYDHDKEFLPEAGLHLNQWSRDIEFRNVALQYPQSKKFALQDVSFVINKGTMVGFVGLSGAGKSSILDLILGLHNPTDGDILIDSIGLKSISHESWRKKIGVVSQDIFIFNETIEENIRFGDEKATSEEIQKAANLAGALDFILQLPEGFKTLIGERGYRLSGGERQRIALARALLKNPEILILDEATSNLDSSSEQLIQCSLERMQKAKTIIIVAHRLSSVAKADQIIVLEKGKIIERGNHSSLIAMKGRYAFLWDLQSDRLYRA